MNTATITEEHKLAVAQALIDSQGAAGSSGLAVNKNRFLIHCEEEILAWRAAHPSRYCSLFAVAYDMIHAAESAARRVSGLILTNLGEGPTLRTWTAEADRHHEVTLTEDLAVPGLVHWVVTMPDGRYVNGGRAVEDTAAAALHVAANRAMDASAASHT